MKKNEKKNRKEREEERREKIMAMDKIVEEKKRRDLWDFRILSYVPDSSKRRLVSHQDFLKKKNENLPLSLPYKFK